MRNDNFCTIYLVRHAESIHNAEYDQKKESVTKTGELGSDLSELGIKQSKDRARTFNKIHFDKIFSSDYLRAKHTADIIALEHKLAVTTNKLLREKFWGKFEGRMHKIDWKRLAELQNGLSDTEKMKIKLSEDMENEEEALARLIIFLREASVAYLGKTILVVCHGNIIRSLLVHLGEARYDELPAGTVENTGYVKLESDGIDFFIKEIVGVNKVKSS